MRVELYINNLTTMVKCNPVAFEALYDAFAIRHPNAFFLRRSMPRGWDGKVRYLGLNGLIKTGLVPKLIEICLKLGYEPKIKEVNFGANYDNQETATRIGKYTIRDYQLDAVKSITERKLLGISFPRGIIKAATNAGKNVLIAFIHKTYNTDSILIFSSIELFNTALEELTDILGKDEIGYIKSGKIIEGKLMIVMAPTLVKSLAKHRKYLEKFKVCFVDECDLSDSNTYKKVLGLLINANVRVGLSGTYSASPLAKNRLRDTNIEAFFSGIVYEIGNKELIDRGFSSKLIIKFYKGNSDKMLGSSYEEQKLRGIIKNKERNKFIIRRAGIHKRNKNLPIIILAQWHKHITILYKRAIKAFPDLRVEMVHHKTKERAKILKDFKEGKIDILIASNIIRRGKNYPLLRAVINSGGGDSFANALQLLGRATRVHKDKEYTFFEDFMDMGSYLMRHSKHRLTVMKREGLEVIEKYK